MPYEHLLSPLRIGTKTMRNRIVAQPMEMNMAENFLPSPAVLKKYRDLAAGGWGCIIIEAVTICETSLARKNCLGLFPDNFLAIKKIVEEMREADSDVLILVQLTHSGRISHPAFSEPVCLYEDETTKGMRVLTDDEIRELQDAFVFAGKKCAEAGADGIDIKSCHGYLGGEFLRPLNRRPGRYGGSFENRVRFLIETYRKVRQEIRKNDFLVGARISAYEGIRGGFGTAGPDEFLEDLTEVLRLAELVKKEGFDYLNVSQGIPALTPEVGRPLKKNYRLAHNAFRYTRDLRQTGMLTIGSAYSVLQKESFDWAEENIAKDYTDLVGWGRQVLADPAMPKKLTEGRLDDIQYCIACSGCSKLLLAQDHVGCSHYDPYFADRLKALNDQKD